MMTSRSHSSPASAAAMPVRKPPLPSPRIGESRALGNHRGQSLHQGRFKLGRSGDASEKQADAMASGLKPSASGRAPAAKSKGEALSSDTRPEWENRLGGDLGGVRLHHDAKARALARDMGAEAFAMGGDVYFAEGRYQPQSPEGRRLLAHELAHTLQPTSEHALRRQPKPGQEGPITARSLFPFREGARLVANHLLNSTFFGLLQDMVPDLAAFLGEGQKGTVLAATDDLFEFRLDNPLSLQARDIDLPMSDQKPHIDAVNKGVVTFRLERNAEGGFDFGIYTQEPGQENPQRFTGRSGLTASRKDGAIMLSQDGQDFLSVAKGDAGDIRLSAQEPLAIEALSLTELPSAPAGSQEEKKAADAITARVANAIGPRQQSLALGVGVQWGNADHALITSAWQYNFQPLAGDLFQVPLEVQIQYAPPTSVLGTVSSGLGTSLASLQVPVNLRFVAGWGAGTVPGKTALDNPDPDDSLVTGPLLGVGLGMEKDWFRFYIRYDHLFNILDQGPSVNTFHWGAAASW